MKFFAALVIVSGCWCIGQSKNARLLSRLSALRALYTGLGVMESEIRGRLAMLPEALLSESRFSPFFDTVLSYMDTEDAEVSFRKAALFHFEKAECEILAQLGAGLLSTEESGLLSALSHAKTRLSALCDTLEGENGRLAKLYTGAGAMAGLLAVILLF